MIDADKLGIKVDVKEGPTANQLERFPEAMRPFIAPGCKLVMEADAAHRAHDTEHRSIANHPGCLTSEAMYRLAHLFERSDISDEAKKLIACPYMLLAMILEGFVVRSNMDEEASARVISINRERGPNRAG